MKLIYLCAFFFTVPSFAQTYTYVPMPTKDMEWKATNSITGSAPAQACSKYKYRFTGNNIVSNGDNFYQIQAIGIDGTNQHVPQTECTDGGAFNKPFTANYSRFYWMAEKNKKIYLLATPGIDSLRYGATLDFSVTKIGDKYGSRYFTDTVMAIDTIEVDNVLRRRIVVDRAYGKIKDTVIEGFGSKLFGLGFRELHEEGLDLKPNPTVICVSKSGQTIYSINNSACAEVWPVSVENEKLSQDIHAPFPNPFHNEVKMQRVKDADLFVYNSVGILVYSQTQIQSDNLSISTATWTPGVYVFTLETNQGRTINKLLKY